MNMSFMLSSIGIISHFMPVGVMVQVILHIIIAIGIMPPIIGIDIMPPIIGMGIGIMFPIMGMFIGIIAGIGIGIVAFMASSISLRVGGSALDRWPYRYERHGVQSMMKSIGSAFSSAVPAGPGGGSGQPA